MTYKKTIFALLTALILHCSNSSIAQENIAPVRHNPEVYTSANTRHYSSARTTALSLPFFEDFTQYSPIPDTNKWLDFQVYINNTMGSGTISRGVATFDALNQYGLPYDTISILTIRYADSLTTKPIDLSGHTPGDSIYLSFFYQPAGIGFAPDKTDSLMLYFRSKTGGLWQKVWSRSDSALQAFKQVLIPVADTNFLYDNFQFRFVNKASIGINDDVWNLDYIRMDAGRNRFDTLINDVSFTQTPTSLLNDYVSMPYRQYLSNTSGERAANFTSSIRNNFESSQNIANFGYTAVHAGSGTLLASGADINRNIPSKGSTDISFNTYSSTPAAGPMDRVIFEQEFYLEAPGTDLHRENDTIVGRQVFDNYLAYDDGTAEMSYYLNLFPSLPGKIAIEHHLNQSDTLRGIAIYFGRQVPLASGKFFSAVVYKNIAYGSSSTDNIIAEIENLRPSYVDTVNHFWIYKFDKPIILPAGTFYLGTTQPALSGSDSLYFGLDRNRTSGNHAYYNVLNVWTPSLISGALMIRPILGGPIKGTSVPEVNSTGAGSFDLSPNPATNELRITLRETNTRTRFEIRNMLGSKLTGADMESSGQIINIADLPPGTYLLQLFSDSKEYPVQKFLKH